MTFSINPKHISKKHTRSKRSDKRSGFTLVELLVVIAIIGILIALLLPAVQAAREAARRIQCSSNFKQVALALHNYEASHRMFPIGMKMTTPCFGWSTMILPYIEQRELYDRYDVQNATIWFSASNVDCPATFINAFLCPSDPQGREWVKCSNGPTTAPGSSNPDEDVARTNICGVADSEEWTKDGRWPQQFAKNDGMFGADGSAHIEDVTDGSSHTLFIGEATGAGPGTHDSHFWATWNLLDTFDGINGPNTVIGGLWPAAAGSAGTWHDTGFSSYHPGGCHFGRVDGSAQFVVEDIDSRVLYAMTTYTGGEVIDMEGSE